MPRNRLITFGLVPLLLAATAFADTSTPIESIAPIWINDIGNAADKSGMLKNKIIQLATAKTDEALNEIEQSAEENTDITHLELTLGSSAFGLDSSSDSYGEVLGVYRLYENSNLFVFNQSSLINQDGRTTFNTGFGVRTINDTETIIVGANAFYDYELSSKHKRTSLGLEALTSAFEIRANHYKAQSGQITYNGINETALDGYDYSIAAMMPYLYSSSLYYKQSAWKDSLTYKTQVLEWGIKAEFLPNVELKIASQKQDQEAAKMVSSITFSKSFGGPEQALKIKQGGNWTASLKPVREKLYKPVERENRIVKKAIKLGVTVSGY